MSDVKVAVKEVTGEDVSNITEVLELLGLKNEGTLKEKVYAAARELNVSIFDEVCVGAQLKPSHPIWFYLQVHLTRSFTRPPPLPGPGVSNTNLRDNVHLIPAMRRRMQP